MAQIDKLLMPHTMMENHGDFKLFQIKEHFWHAVMITPFMNSVLLRKKWWNKERFGLQNSLEENHMKLQRLSQLPPQWAVILPNNKLELLHIAKNGIMLQLATIMVMLLSWIMTISLKELPRFINLKNGVKFWYIHQMKNILQSDHTTILFTSIKLLKAENTIIIGQL